MLSIHFVFSYLEIEREQVRDNLRGAAIKIGVQRLADSVAVVSGEDQKVKMSEHIFQLKTLEECLKNVPAEDLKDLKTHIYGRADE